MATAKKATKKAASTKKQDRVTPKTSKNATEKKPLYGGLHEKYFRSRAKNAVMDYWNHNKNLTSKFGTINDQQIFIVWQVKVIQNSKALLGVNINGDGMYFECTWNGDSQEMYLDVYKKQAHKVVTY